MATNVVPVEQDSSVPGNKSKFFPSDLAIDPNQWDKYSPYQLVMVKAGDPDPNTGEVSYTPLPYRFTLPIPPQELTLDMPIPTNIQATLTGIATQHGGAPFRDIMLQGTTGITPAKARGVALGQRGVIESIFAGTVNNLAQARTSASKLFTGTASNLNVFTGLGSTTTDQNTILQTSTGYFQMRLMERFIETYLAIKVEGSSTIGSTTASTSTGMTVTEGNASGDFNTAGIDPRKVRLAFAMWKDQSVYLVEPLKFTKRRSVQSPMEYMFNLQLKAYKRITLSQGAQGSLAHQFVARKPALISQVFNRFNAARQLLSNLSDVVQSMINDPTQQLAEAMRETSLFLAEVSGAKATIDNLPSDFDDPIFSAVATQWRQLRTKFLSLVSPALDKKLIDNNNQMTAVERQELKTNVWPKLSPSQLQLPVSARRKIQQEINRVKKFTRSDFEAHRDAILKGASDFADRIGAGNATYAQQFNRKTPSVTRTPTNSEFDVLFCLNEIAQSLDHLAVSQQIDPKVPTSIEYVAGLAEGSGIAFKVPRSKRAVPFPYGFTLERLSLLYLGDADRWHEIATLNGLRSPYIDEIGFSLSLLTNGNGNTISVLDRVNLFQGQTVWLSSTQARRDKRHILRIDTISPTQHLLTLDGDPDLDKFTVAGTAVLETFLPGTVNSQQSIFIPSDIAAPEDPRTKQVPGVNDFDGLLQVSGIDLLLTPNGDLAITPDGDCRVAFGLQNVIQTVKLALGTPRGALLQHPQYGLPISVGMSTADANAEDILNAAKELFNNDPMFSGVRSAFVQKDGSVLQITLDVGVAGTSQFVPVTVVLQD